MFWNKTEILQTQLSSWFWLVFWVFKMFLFGICFVLYFFKLLAGSGFHPKGQLYSIRSLIVATNYPGCLHAFLNSVSVILSRNATFVSQLAHQSRIRLTSTRLLPNAAKYSIQYAWSASTLSKENLAHDSVFQYSSHNNLDLLNVSCIETLTINWAKVCVICETSQRQRTPFNVDHF